MARLTPTTVAAPTNMIKDANAIDKISTTNSNSITRTESAGAGTNAILIESRTCNTMMLSLTRNQHQEKRELMEKLVVTNVLAVAEVEGKRTSDAITSNSISSPTNNLSRKVNNTSKRKIRPMKAQQKTRKSKATKPGPTSLVAVAEAEEITGLTKSTTTVLPARCITTTDRARTTTSMAHRRWFTRKRSRSTRSLRENRALSRHH